MKRIFLLFSLIFALSFNTSIYASSGETSLFDVMPNKENTAPDSEVMEEVGGTVTSIAGTLTSVIIYVLFAGTTFTTACDLLYVAVPVLRPYLYDGNTGSDKVGSANATVLGRNTTWTNMAQDSMNKANQSSMQSQAYVQQAQNLASMGDKYGAERAMSKARSQGNLANMYAQSADRRMSYQAEDDASRSRINQEALDSAQRRAERNAK